MFRRPVYKKLTDLYENYNNDVGVKEDRTKAERKEEEDFLDEVMKSKVMKETLQFLKNNKIFTKSKKDFRNLLKELWFDVYSRGRRILGSSGFEHVFLGEKKNGTVQGFHNWVYFHHLEQKNDINYLGHWEKVELGDKGTGLAFTFKWGEEQKPYASMVVGVSPQLELAVYTVCILTRYNNTISGVIILYPDQAGAGVRRLPGRPEGHRHHPRVQQARGSQVCGQRLL